MLCPEFLELDCVDRRIKLAVRATGLAKPKVPKGGDCLAIASARVDQDVLVTGLRQAEAHQRG